MITFPRTATAALLALSLALPVAASGTAFAATAPAPISATGAPAVHLELPRPTGPHAVGRSIVHLVDKSRRDPWVPRSGARELMLSLYYPAHRGSGRPSAYMTTEEARLLLASQHLEGKVPARVVSATRTFARTGARPADGRHPLVVLSPGFGLPRTTLTLLAEDLASRGYVVATVDHAYEAAGTAFPGGRTLTCVACETVKQGQEGSVTTNRARDLSFVIDQLTGRRPAWKYGRMIDPKRIGMAGHSIGGDSTARTMASDDRIRAGVNMDGVFNVPLPASGLQGRPFLLLGNAGHRPGGPERTWDEGWARLNGWKRWLTVSGTNHLSFLDLPVLAAQLGVHDPSAPLPGPRAAQLTRSYVGAFFDRHLRSIREPLLDGPSAANPEVRFELGSADG
ncbi:MULTISPECIES: alpha/beta hydrolase [unclassified Streptomyces]|uniref:alpha/beta hydrolase family protein n=1 Tax=unclassified Streptomyces TaxID=2593676 RepID=UPI0008812BBC|nr:MULTISPECIES: alpha/beta hydrolase [unclassified Streptomyces]PBC83474.1 platelet-activating factor acetylhydrolase isoform II [Streptomyces sp. 2321.6]SDR42011.1 Platelet-activating factor acetylhydrolase, isoform II [Streptomyces sp. KS_16]SEC97863.1 Platelet-activating factor acetylhydrolase, isoform II [Streptomyces sp. 2133.1]SNC69552.1 Platelet-activating factor acetylhydrolase, isoform II [Streptomyces sp. 2114.4]